MSVSRLSQLRREGGAFVPGPSVRVRVTGADRLRYLNGQVSNDLKQLQPGSALPALLLTGRGKLCALVFVWHEGEAIMVEAEGVSGDDFLARLERYAISDDVAFELLHESEPRYHLFGATASGATGMRVSRLGDEGLDVGERPEGIVLASPAEIECLRVERGVPKWGRELGEDTLPQEAGLEKTAVNFQKGCYVGQEVVSRIQSVGRVNRELVGFVGDFDPARAAGLQTSDGTKAGTVTSAILHPELGRSVALGFVSTRLSETTFVVVDETGACLGGAERSQFPLIS